MAFWGIEVKPGKPIIHSCEKARGRLRISQATLGIGEATKKTVVQCNVGRRTPVLLCALLPEKTESCHLDLEFQEADDVVFSVIGPRSVYLTGYYVRQSPQLNPHSDTESYGVDIENTQTEGSSHGSDDDNYDDSFIDDDELQVSPQSPILNNKGEDEVIPENDKPKGTAGHGKQRKKRLQVIESDDEDDRFPESEDEKDFLLSVFMKTARSDSEEKVADVTAEAGKDANDKGVCDESKQKIGPYEVKVAGAAKMGNEAKYSGEDEVIPENDKPKGVAGPGKQRKKKLQVIESDDEDDRFPKSEDEKDLPLSVFKGKRAMKTAPPDSEEKVADVTSEVGSEANDKGVCDESVQKLVPSEEKVVGAAAEMGNGAKDSGVCDESTHNVDPLYINDEPGRPIRLPLDEEGTDVGNKMHGLPNPEEAKIFEGIISSNEDVVTGDTVNKNNAKDSIIDQNLSLAKTIDQMQSLDFAKPKKKRKERSKRGERTCDIQTHSTDHNVLVEDKEREVKATASMETDANYAGILLELGSAREQKLKRRKTAVQQTESQVEGIDEERCNNSKDDALESLLHSNSNNMYLPAASGECQDQHMEGIDTKRDSMLNEEEFDPGLQHSDHMAADPPASNEELQIDKNPELVVNDSRPRKKSKEMKKKAQGKSRETTNGEQTTVIKRGDENMNTVPIRRTLSNGLIIEELANGLPDGKVAALGKKIKIYYNGMLKENEFVFDSNMGKRPFKFRLGDSTYIDGWNAGIDGMHVGDKRRLIIPPSMGFGKHGVRDVIPPNSWLVYDIELVSVRN